MTWNRIITRSDVSQVATLGRQLFPGCSKVSTVCYTDALSVGPYSYLIVDASSHSEDTYPYNQKDGLDL
jgi:hypothetical protein